MLGWDDLAIVGFMVGEYVYHRWMDPSDSPPSNAEKNFKIPRVDGGAPHSLLYGRCRVQQPVLAWIDTPKSMAGSSITGLVPSGANAQWAYGLDMFYVLGIPFEGSGSASRVYNMWAGDRLLNVAAVGGSLSSLDGNRTFNSGTGLWDHADVGGGLDANTIIFGQLEYLNGNPSQVLIDSGGTAQSAAGVRMLDAGLDYTLVPAYRNFLSVFLYGAFSGTGFRWIVGPSASVDSYSFEVQSLPTSWLGPNQQVATLDGDLTVQNGDANPVDVLYDALTGTRGKLGLATSLVDTASFAAAAATLDAEGNGYSRAWQEDQRPISEMISEILQQVDGVLYEDPSTGTVKIKLVRDDYDITAVPLINPDNCEGLKNFAAGGWTDIVNKVVLTFTNRDDGYKDGTATAQNQANAVGQDGTVRVVKLAMPGICSQALADEVAQRELAARCRPMMKCKAIVSRDFFATCPGDVVRLSWPEYGLSNVPMRVANVNRGTLEDGRIELDLLQDYYHAWRLRLAGGTHFPPIGVTSAH